MDVSDSAHVGLRMRSVLEEKVRGLRGRIVVPLSAGVDSTSVLLAILHTHGHRDVEAWSFQLEGVESTDCQVARANAEYLRVPHSIITLPLANREADLKYLIGRGFQGKAALECGWPMYRLLLTAYREKHKVRTVVTGSAADGHYGLSKRAMIHYSPKLETFDEFRRAYFADPDKAQVRSVAELGKGFGIEVRAPYHSPEMCEVTLGVPWGVLNKPRQKEAMRLAFPEMDRLRTGRHVNLQLGDSGIAASFAELAEEQGFSSARKMYSTWIKEYGRQDSALF